MAVKVRYTTRPKHGPVRQLTADLYSIDSDGVRLCQRAFSKPRYFTVPFERVIDIDGVPPLDYHPKEDQNAEAT